MLRIHIKYESEEVNLRLEGKLVELWVDELVRVWLDLTNRLPRETTYVVDLNDISFVDARGKALLGSMLKVGCSLHGTAPFIASVLEEVRSSLSL